MLNNDIEIGEIQENRIWIHSKKSQYGKWVDSSIIAGMVSNTKKKTYADGWNDAIEKILDEHINPMMNRKREKIKMLKISN